MLTYLVKFSSFYPQHINTSLERQYVLVVSALGSGVELGFEYSIYKLFDFGYVT